MADWEPYLKDVPEEHRDEVQKLLEEQYGPLLRRVEQLELSNWLRAANPPPGPWHWRDERCEVCGEWVPVARERPVEHVLCFEHRGDSDGPS